jgi:ATP-dependent DNA helicase RecG
MSEELELGERVSLAIRIGESHFREFKSAQEGPPDTKAHRPIRDLMTDVGRTLVGFANADGGELLIGVEDDGTVSGVPHSETDIALLLKAPITHIHADTPIPTPRAVRVPVGSKTVVYFAVVKGTRFVHLTADGRCLKRVDRDTLPFSSEGINSTRLEDDSRKWDREIAHGVTLDDLEIDLLKATASQVAYGISPEKLLQHLDLAEFSPDGIRLRKAAVVLFSKDVRKWHAGSLVRIVTVKGTSKGSGDAFNVVKDILVADNLVRLIERAWESLTTALAQQTRFTADAKFRQDHMYPQVACREALTNAITHRNYAIEGRGVEITIFDDRMEVVSPGMLLSTISIEDIRSLKGAHESRNPLVARVLREIGLVQEMGEGMRRIFAVMKSNALAAPKIVSDRAGFTVALYNRSLYEPEVKLWLSNFDRFDLDENQRAVIALGYGGKEFSTQDIIDRLGIIDTDKVRELVSRLRQHGVLDTTRGKNEVERYKERNRVPRRSVPKYRILEEGGGSEATGLAGPIDEDFGSQSFEVYLGNLSYDISVSEITDFLASRGCDVLDVRIPRGPGADAKGFAFATVVSKAGVDATVALLDQEVLRGRVVHARLARSRTSKRRDVKT